MERPRRSAAMPHAIDDGTKAIQMGTAARIPWRKRAKKDMGNRLTEERRMINYCRWNLCRRRAMLPRVNIFTC